MKKNRNDTIDVSLITDFTQATYANDQSIGILYRIAFRSLSVTAQTIRIPNPLYVKVTKSYFQQLHFEIVKSLTYKHHNLPLRVSFVLHFRRLR